MTPEQIRQAVIAHNPSYDRHRSLVMALLSKGKARQAKELQNDYEARLSLFKQQMRRCPKNQM